ncbi:puromycin-sensitive aminopeptidase [Octopus sinensis]|uniref:Aminopeptidase n=1 Tax=Octopus sinensis TaxID=2607531 RepID=A0A6P7TEW0_9MOLL|nr:puromycin-sensitive aminopeptidase [Octopus sinensis]
MAERRPFEHLPSTVIPVNYALLFKPDLETFKFTGSGDIDVQIKEPVESFKLNAAELTVSKASFKYEGGEPVDLKISFVKENENVIFSSSSTFKAGFGVLHIEFAGELNDRMRGFYHSQYTVSSGKVVHLAVTQFESTDARRAFPCWDEPSFKATFDITLVFPNHLTGLSNMPVTEEKTHSTDPKLKVMKFERSPKMSTYLLAFIIGEFDYLEGRDSDNVLVRVYTPLEKRDQGQFALDVTVKTLPFYKSYFNIAYPLPKIDLIAIPDFLSGAMENWGLVTYRENTLLIDAEDSSAKSRQLVALVIGHELAHMWFGNLVTMEWWTHLWLNEGFASWIEYLCVDKLFPDFEIWTQFVTSDLAAALKLDALHTSHPIEVPVGHPAEVDEIFDAISYCKGASVIRMLHNYIEDTDFKKGMNSYLTKFMYKNAATEDLWDALESASGKPIKRVMSTWTSQMGYPVVKVSETKEDNRRVLHLTQMKFCADGKTGDKTSRWMIPIDISTSSSIHKPVKKVLMEGEKMEVILDNVKTDEWVLLNCNSVGVYRVQYSSDMLQSLLKGIVNKTILPTNRLALQSDMFALARAGMVSTVEVLKFVQSYKNEDNYTVWNDLAQNLTNIALLLQYTKYYDQYKVFVRNLFRKIAAKVGWEATKEENHLTTLLRDLVLCRMGRYGDAAVLEESRKRFQDHVSGEKILPADLKSPVYLTVVCHGDEEVLTSMLELYEKAQMQEEMVRISRTIGAVSESKLITRVLEFAISDRVRSQDTVFVIAGVTGTVLGREMAWQFVRDHWQFFCERYQGGALIARLVKFTTENFASENRANEVEEFFAAHPAASATRNIQQSCENIRLNAWWLANESDEVGKFLDDIKED